MSLLYIALALIVILAVCLKLYNFLDGRNLLLDKLNILYLMTRSIAAWDRVWQENSKQADLIVCLTTLPSRINHIEWTLKSLLAQSVRPKKIRLHIPEFSKREQRKYSLPSYLFELNAVEIVRCADAGPATKLLPALNALSLDQKILIVDDDTLYPPRFVEWMNGLAEQHSEVAICASGWIVPKDLTDRPSTLWLNIHQLPPFPLKSTRIRGKREIDVMQGYAGYLVKPRFFTAAVLDYDSAPEAAFFVDDVWLSGHCKVPKYVFPSKRFCFQMAMLSRTYKRTSISRLNRGGGDPQQRNNTKLIRYFDPKRHWLLHRLPISESTGI